MHSSNLLQLLHKLFGRLNGESYAFNGVPYGDLCCCRSLVLPALPAGLWIKPSLHRPRFCDYSTEPLSIFSTSVLRSFIFDLGKSILVE